MQIVDQSSFKRPSDIRNILLIQLGDIGDVVWTTPAIRAAKTSIPDACVSVLVKEGFGGLLETDPFIDRIFEVKSYAGGFLGQAAGQLSFLKELRSQRFDLAVDLRLGDRGAFMAFASGAPVRVTMHDPHVPSWRKYLFTHGVVPADRPPERGAAKQTLRILRVLGIDTSDKTPRLTVSDAFKRRAQDILFREGAEGLARWITINPFSRWSYKEWTAAGWAELINDLERDFSVPVVLIGSADERPKAQALMRQCRAQVFNLAGKTTLAELAGLLGQSLLHIGVDSAGPHIAAAVGVPTVTIYGPSSWFEWAPTGEEHRVVLPEMDCTPCHQKGCGGSGRSRCLDELSVARVKKVLYEKLDQLTGNRRTAPVPVDFGEPPAKAPIGFQP